MPNQWHQLTNDRGQNSFYSPHTNTQTWRNFPNRLNSCIKFHKGMSFWHEIHWFHTMEQWKDHGDRTMTKTFYELVNKHRECNYELRLHSSNVWFTRGHFFLQSTIAVFKFYRFAFVWAQIIIILEMVWLADE